MENAFCLIDDLCRLCLEGPGTRNIFESDQLIHDVLLCTGILEISRSDKLPQSICTNCMFKIEAAKDLREYAVSNTLYLQALLSDEENMYEIAKPKIVLSSSLIEEAVVRLISSTECRDILSENHLKSLSSVENNVPQGKRLRENEFETVSITNEQITKRPKISVRSLADINSDYNSLLVTTSSGKDENALKSDHHSCKTDNISIKSEHKTSKLKHNSEKKHKNSKKEHKNSKKAHNNSKKAHKISKKEHKRSKTEHDDSKKEHDNSKNEDYISTKDDDSSKTQQLPKTEKNSPSKTSLMKSGENKCDVCAKVFATPKKLYLHNRAHYKTLYCPLDACLKKFATKGDLQKHIRAHTGEKPFKCNICGKSFSQNVTLRSHRETVHNVNNIKIEKDSIG